MNIGLTGGMGCGKSEVLQWFRCGGHAVFEADACVRDLLVRDACLQADLRATFGDRIFNAEGGVDRGVLGSIVFSDPSSLAVLEELMHPRVRSAWHKELEKHHQCLVVEIPLLFEKDLQSAFELTCCVVSDPKIQLTRLRARGWSDAHIAQRLGRQWSLERKAQGADIVILNDGSRTHLHDQLAYWSGRIGINPPLV